MMNYCFKKTFGGMVLMNSRIDFWCVADGTIVPRFKRVWKKADINNLYDVFEKDLKLSCDPLSVIAINENNYRYY